VTEQEEHGDPPEVTARTSITPRNWVEALRTKLPAGSGRRRLYDKLALPVDEPTEFVTDEATLAAELMPEDTDEDKKVARAAELLTEAQSIYERAEDRAAGAIARATTLQGAVAIATSRLLAGAGLVIGKTALQGIVWIVFFAVLLVGATVALVMTGVRALSATSTIHRWHRPTATDIVRRSQLGAAEARVQLAAETLIDYGYNTKIAAWKVAYLGAAAWWFRIALALLLALAVFVGSYAVFGEPSSTASSKTSTTVVVKIAERHRSFERRRHHHRRRHQESSGSR
jgi:hypothetical protein